MGKDPVADLIAKQEITELLYTYCRALDRVDWELLPTVFHPDAFCDYGAELFQGDRDGLARFAHGGHQHSFNAHQHQIGNILIRVEGDRAASEAYCTATFCQSGDDGEPVIKQSYSRYVDRWEKRDGKWAILARKYLHMTDEARRSGRPDLAVQGSRDRNDPSYAFFGGI